MDERLGQVVWDTIVEMWQAQGSKGTLETSKVYEKLVGSGEEIPNYAMSEFLILL